MKSVFKTTLSFQLSYSMAAAPFQRLLFALNPLWGYGVCWRHVPVASHFIYLPKILNSSSPTCGCQSMELSHLVPLLNIFFFFFSGDRMEPCVFCHWCFPVLRRLSPISEFYFSVSAGGSGGAAQHKQGRCKNHRVGWGEERTCGSNTFPSRD